jgi:cysteine rich repeat protein
MLRIILTAALLSASSAALAQQLTAAQRDACMGDYQKYCKSVTPGGGRIIACLSKESDKLTPACRKVLAEAGK